MQDGSSDWAMVWTLQEQEIFLFSRPVLCLSTEDVWISCQVCTMLVAVINSSAVFQKDSFYT